MKTEPFLVGQIRQLQHVKFGGVKLGGVKLGGVKLGGVLL
jgi:hypothetical protein